MEENAGAEVIGLLKNELRRLKEQNTSIISGYIPKYKVSNVFHFKLSHRHLWNFMATSSFTNCQKRIVDQRN